MSRKPKENNVKTEPTPPTRVFADDTPEESRLLILARDDQKAVKQARLDGKPIPATPNLDHFHERYAAMTSTRATTKSASAGRTKGRTDIRYFHDGRSMSETHKHKLSTLAYFHSHDIAKGSQARLSTKEFIAELAKLGVTDAGEPGWMVKLPNGITVECRVDGEKSQFTGTPPARKASASKKTTAPAAKSTAAPKPAKVTSPVKKQTPGAKKRAAEASTSSARAKAGVSPRPKAKASTAKKTTGAKRAPAKRKSTKKAA